MTFEDAQCEKVELYPIGGQIVSIGDMIQEIRAHRRDLFFRHLFSIEEGDHSNNCCFDAIAFLAATEDFEQYFRFNEVNFEGSITYDVVAGNDWIWHCKTTITWVDTYPIAFGAFKYHTTVVENETVWAERIYVMNGTGLDLRVFKKELKSLSGADALERTRRNHC